MIVKYSKHGRGVYATRNHKKGSVVEFADVIIFPQDEVKRYGILSFYVYEWRNTSYAIGLGFSSLYNHSLRPNLVIQRNYAAIQLEFIAKRDIKNGEELRINYGYSRMLSKNKAKFARGEI